MTFLLPTNIVLQDEDNNRNLWAIIEEYSRAAVRHAMQPVVVVSGPLWLPTEMEIPKFSTRHRRRATHHTMSQITFRVFGSQMIAVPTHLFKVIASVTNVGPRVESFIVPNAPSNSSMNEFRSALRFVETYSGLDFQGLTALCRLATHAPSAAPAA